MNREAEIRPLNDKNQFPTEKVIFSHLGKTKTLWPELFDYIRHTYPAYIQEWRYYNDGKSWLLKVTKKAKTACWVSVIKGGFRMTCYFTDKAEKAIKDSKLPAELKRQFLAGKHYNKIRGLTVIFKSKKDLETARILLAIKDNIL